MSTERTANIDEKAEAEAPPGLGTRLLSLGALLGVVGASGWFVLQIVSVFTNAWIAPINLSPDNDHVVSMNLQIVRQLGEVERAEAELNRHQLQIAAIDEGIARLERLRTNSNEVFRWEADVEGSRAEAVRRSTRALLRQQRTLATQRQRHAAAVEEARANLAAGLIGRRDLETEEHVLAQIELQIASNERALIDARLQEQMAQVQADTYRASSHGGAPTSQAVHGQMPTVVARQEQAVHLELQIAEMQAERRGLQMMQDVGTRNLARLREALDQIRSRPLYRATQQSLDVAFVPYEQLDGVHRGAVVMQCTFWIFACHDVGRVTEVLPGEVVTQDPWGEMARGRYAVLHLDDPLAVQERILRVR